MPFLNPTSHATADDVVAHIEHAVDVCGEDHVGIGTDGPVTASLRYAQDIWGESSPG
jgi:membrane dipeptidase